MNFSDYAPFRGLNQTQIDNFVTACEKVTFEAGTALITKGEHGQSVYFLIEGEIRVFLPNAKTHRELGHLSPPAVVGEMELLTGRPRTASVEAVTRTTVLEMPFDTLRNRMQDGDTATLKVMVNIGRVLALRLASATEKLGEMDGDEKRREELDEFRVKLFSDWSF